MIAGDENEVKWVAGIKKSLKTQEYFVTTNAIKLNNQNRLKIVFCL